jgi:hypothetical protein
MRHWALQNEAQAKRLEAFFKRRGIACNVPGFCDHDAFLRLEQENPRLLEPYAHYIETKIYTPEYLTIAHQKITIVAGVLRAAIEQDGRLGACVDASGILSRMLDRAGVFNYIAQTCLTISYPPDTFLENTYFYAIDSHPMTAPHEVVVAPPFYVVDITAKYQPYGANQADFLPEMLLLDRFTRANWTPEDIVAPEFQIAIIRGGVSLNQFLARNYSNVMDVMQMLPARQMTHSPLGTVLKYIPVAVGGVIEPLEQMTGYQPCGRMPHVIFNEDVLPLLTEIS